MPSALALQALRPLFLGAGLMDLVEPMVAKMVLPRIEDHRPFGARALISRRYCFSVTPMPALARLSSRLAQILVHVGLVCPLQRWRCPRGRSDAGRFTRGVVADPASARPGPPVFAISATAPLLQSWFAKLDHEAAGALFPCMLGATPVVCSHCSCILAGRTLADPGPTGGAPGALPCWSWGSRPVPQRWRAKAAVCRRHAASGACPLEHSRAFGLDRPGVRAILTVTRRHHAWHHGRCAAPLLWVVPLMPIPAHVCPHLRATPSFCAMRQWFGCYR